MKNLSKIPIIKDRKMIIQKLEETRTKASENMICYYSSQINCFITDPVFFSVSMEDKIVHRGYSVFDTVKIFGSKIFNIDSHIERLTKSIESIYLKPLYNHNDFKKLLLQAAFLARDIEPSENVDIDLRYFYSAGLGNFSVQENENMHTFYILAIRADNSIRPVEGTKDFLVNKPEIVEKTSKAKTTNYMHNCIINKISKQKGGYMGIITDKESNLLESPISNIAFVNKNDEFVFPSFDKTLRGTTIIKCVDFIEKTLIPEGDLKAISRKDVNIEDIKKGNIKEAFFVGGDFLLPLLEIEGIKLSEKKGKIAEKLQDFLSSQKKEKADDLAELKKLFDEDLI